MKYNMPHFVAIFLAHLIHGMQMCYCYRKLENQSKLAFWNGKRLINFGY